MTAVYILGYLNMLPSALAVYLFYILPMTLAKQISYMPVIYPMKDKEVVHWYVVVKDSWLDKRFKYGGFAAGPFVVLRSGMKRSTQERVMLHEATHVLQGYIFGTLIPTAMTVLLIVSWFNPDMHVHWWGVMLLWLFTSMPCLYGIFSIFVWIFIKKEHSYYDNPFEMWARWRVEPDNYDVPPSKWRDGEDDRWLWW